MFLGEYNHHLDPKGRLAIPSHFREEFKEGLVLTRGLDKCLVVYPPPEWEKMVEKIASLPTTRIKARRIARFVFSSTFYLKLDGQGRILLPLSLRQYAELKKIVFLIGVNSYVEIWDKELWEKEKALTSQNAWQFTEEIELR